MSQPTTFGPKTARAIYNHVFGQQPPRELPDQGGPSLGTVDRYQPTNVFKNDTSETIPGYALIRITGVEVDADGRFRLLAQKPDGSGDAHLVNGPSEVEAGTLGSYQDASNHFVLLTDADSGSVGPGTDWPAVAGTSTFKVLGQIKTDAPKLALVATIGGGVTIRAGRTSEEIGVGSVGQVDEWDFGANNFKVDEEGNRVSFFARLLFLHGGVNVSAGKEVLVAEVGGVPLIIGAQCEGEHGSILT